MNQRIFIRLSHDASAAASWLRASEAGLALGNVMSGTLEQAAAEIVQQPGVQIVVLAPATEIVFAQAAVPGRARLAQAVPYALEEQLAADVEQLHFALGRREADGRINTAVVSRAHMEDWLARLDAAGVQPDTLVSELQLLPLAPGEWSALRENGVVTVRTGAQQGLVVDSENLEAMMRAAMTEAGVDAPARVHLIDADLDTPLAAAVEGVEFVREPCPAHPLSRLAKNFDAQGVINLLQGEYSRREQLGRLWRPWRAAAALLAVWLVFNIGITVFESIQLAREQSRLTAQVEQLYRKTFPDARKVVNVRVQMQRGLDALRASADAGNADFLGLLAASGAALHDNSAITLRGISYKDRQLEIDLEAKDMQALDQLKQRLMQSALAVEIQSAAAREGKVDGRLQIRRRS
ncbi:MAG: type II secretion system protein GspL [Gammaproteobacteria bacterium]|nr:type II secretion system protein GspL [Gammaproteobacteria bacterium]